MEKKLSNRREEVIKLLARQKIRTVKDLESYKLSECHPHSAGMVIELVEI